MLFSLGGSELPPERPGSGFAWPHDPEFDRRRAWGRHIEGQHAFTVVAPRRRTGPARRLERAPVVGCQAGALNQVVVEVGAVRVERDAELPPSVGSADRL